MINKMKFSIIFMLIFLVSCEEKTISIGALNAPVFSFPSVVDLGSSFSAGYSANISSTVIDKDNNVYAVVAFKGELDGVVSGGKDIALFKYSSKGQLLWKRHLSSSLSSIQDSSQDEDATTLLLDEEEKSLYFIGNTKSSFIESNPTGNSDIILGKVSVTGNILWLRHYGEETKNKLELSTGETLDLSLNEVAGAINFSPNKSLIAAFYTGGSFFEPSAGGDDIVVMSINTSNGNIIRGRQLGSKTLASLGGGGAGNDRHTQGSFSFDGNKIVLPYWTSGVMTESNTNWDGGYVVFNENLTVNTIKQLGQETYAEWVGKGNYSGTVNLQDQFRSVVVLAPNDYLFFGKTTGSLGEPLNGTQDIFFARYKDHELVSLTQHGTITSPTSTLSEEARIITKDEKGNVYAMGHTRSAVFEPMVGRYFAPYVLRVDSDGKLLNGIQLGNAQSTELGLDGLYYTLISAYTLAIKDGRIVIGANDQASTSSTSLIHPYLWSFPAP